MTKFKILIPCYNDWPSALRLLENIDKEIETSIVNITRKEVHK